MLRFVGLVLVGVCVGVFSAVGTVREAAAASGKTPLAVLGVESLGAPQAVAARLTGALREAVERHDRVEPRPGRDLVEMRFVFGCIEDAGLGPCLAEACRPLGARLAILGTLRQVGTGKKRATAGTYLVHLRLLDVGRGTFADFEVRQKVTAEALSRVRLPQSADRWVGALLRDLPANAGLDEVAESQRARGASPDKAAAPLSAAKLDSLDAERPDLKAAARAAAPERSRPEAPPAPPSPGRRSRRLLVAGVVFTVLAVVAFGAAVGTWKKYSDDQGSAHDALAELASNDASYYLANRSFFSSPTCNLPAAPTPPAADAKAFSDACSSSHSFSLLTTGLVVTGAVLGVVGVGSLAGSAVLSRGEGRSGRAVSLAPSPGGLALSFW